MKERRIEVFCLAYALVFGLLRRSDHSGTPCGGSVPKPYATIVAGCGNDDASHSEGLSLKRLGNGRRKRDGFSVERYGETSCKGCSVSTRLSFQMSMPSISDGGDGLQPVRLFNRMAIEEKGEGARLVRRRVALNESSELCLTSSRFNPLDLLCRCHCSRRFG